MRIAAQGLTAFVCCISFLGFAQETTPPAQAPPLVERPGTAPEHENGRRIEIDVVVTDKAGAPVSGLQPQDFTLLDDKQPQKVLSFAAFDETNAATAPAQQVILVVDAVNTSYSTMGTERLQLDKLLHSGGQLPVPTSFVFLTDTHTQIQPTPSRDGNVLAGILDSNQAGLRIVGRSQGFYGAAERVQLSIRALDQLIAYEAKQPGRKLVIWLSPGWALLSGPNIDLTAKDQEVLFNTVVQLSAALRAARITLYSVDPLGMSEAGSGRTFYYQEFLKGVPSAKKVQNGNLGLQVLAAQSGGRVLNSSNDVAGLIASCLADAKAFYSISFDAPRADHPNEYHSLEIKIGKPGLAARTRTGYYAQP